MYGRASRVTATSEYAGSTFGNTGTWTQNDLGHALMTAELTGRLTQDSRVVASAYWTTRWVHDTSTTPQDEYDALDASNNLFAQGKALSIFGNNTLATMVSASPQEGKAIAFATYDPPRGATRDHPVFKVEGDTRGDTETRRRDRWTEAALR